VIGEAERAGDAAEANPLEECLIATCSEIFGAAHSDTVHRVLQVPSLPSRRLRRIMGPTYEEVERAEAAEAAAAGVDGNGGAVRVKSNIKLWFRNGKDGRGRGGTERKFKRRRGAGDVFSRSKPKKNAANVQQGKALREFVPCDHEGPCTDSTKCSCAANDVYCEKFCACGPECSRKFVGCGCSRGRCNTGACVCYAANRDCDPDLCPSCGASDLPVNKGGAPVVSGLSAPHEHEVSCRNVSLLKRQHKRIAAGRSSIHGWGAYLRDYAEKNDFICEYTGEMVSQDEADRRGKIYDKLKCSFLFNLNEEIVVDATRKGNKIKYANHHELPNCYARIKLVAGDHKIGIFAKRDIEPGEELSFNYSNSYWTAGAVESGTALHI